MAKSGAKSNRIFRCPTCRTIILGTGEDFPFCSDHCRQVDLGKWATGVYRISSPVLDPEVLEGLDSDTRPRSEDDSY
jgi:endogenous inhibitor of DNA gyrase (YacG/DUF329 family)